MSLAAMITLALRSLFVFYFALAEAITADKAEQKVSSYAPGDAIPVSCLNRTT